MIGKILFTCSVLGYLIYVVVGDWRDKKLERKKQYDRNLYRRIFLMCQEDVDLCCLYNGKMCSVVGYVEDMYLILSAAIYTDDMLSGRDLALALGNRISSPNSYVELGHAGFYLIRIREVNLFRYNHGSKDYYLVDIDEIINYKKS